MLTGCSVSSASDYVPYKELPQDYSVESATHDNVVVYKNSDIISGQSTWDAFIEKLENKKASSVRLGFYFTLEDPSHYSPEHYEEIKDDYPVLYILDLSYDGKLYTLFSIEDGEEYVFQYKYLRQFVDSSPPASATYIKREMWILINDNDISWEEIQHGMFSSQWGDYIDHRVVYSKYTYKYY